MNPEVFKLTLEQEFNMQVYTDAVDRMPKDQLQKMILELMRQLMIKDNCIRHIMKEGL